jgi:6-phosphofructokinase 2
MPAILTVTFNPCIDVYTSVPALRPHCKLRCSDPRFDPGGGGINVARAITRLGGDTIALYPAGGATGIQLKKMLNSEDVRSVTIPIAGETRRNTIVTDNATGLQYQLNMPGPTLEKNDIASILSIIEAQPTLEYLVVSGSLAPGITNDIFAKLSAIAEKKQARLVIDVPGEALKDAIKTPVYLIKPSIHELLTISEKTGDERLIKDLAKDLVAKGRCEVIVVSMGPAGALLVTKDSIRQLAAPPVNVHGTVGAGDSMVAGIVLALHDGKTLEEAVAFGCVCGAAATLHPGTSLCNKEDVELLLRIGANHLSPPLTNLIAANDKG